jgi:hypothetical protein
VPVVHAALAAGLPKPLAVLNLGGVANVTWIGPRGELLAFDTGPANGPLDDWARRKAGRDYDSDGRLALAGSRTTGLVGETLEEILAAVAKVAGLVGEVTVATEEQSRGIEEVTQVVGEVGRGRGGGRARRRAA